MRVNSVMLMLGRGALPDSCTDLANLIKPADPIRNICSLVRPSRDLAYNSKLSPEQTPSCTRGFLPEPAGKAVVYQA